MALLFDLANLLNLTFWAWIDTNAPRNPFAAPLRKAIRRRLRLSERQLEAVRPASTLAQ